MTTAIEASTRRIVGCLLGCLTVLLAGAGEPARAQGPVITAIVQAGSVGNSLNILITNDDDFSPVVAVSVRLAGGTTHVRNLRIEPERIDSIAPSSAHQVKVHFDVAENVPDEGARATVRFRITAAEGLLDHSELTLHLGIETKETALHIVPHVVTMTVEEAEAALGRARLVAQIEELRPPADRQLFGLLAEQAVPSGTIVPARTRIGLLAYPAHAIAVPAVAGLLIEEAARIVADAGLTPQRNPLGEAPSPEEANRVERTEPSGGTNVVPRSTVALFAYGPFRAPEPDSTEPPPVAALAAWDQPWRIELKLAGVVVAGREMSLLDALKRYGSKPDPTPDREGVTDPLLAMPGAVADMADVAGGLVEIMATTVMLAAEEAGLPLGFTLVEEQGGFRLVVPGSSGLVDWLNRGFATLPLLLPAGPTGLEASARQSVESGSRRLRMKVEATPDWTELRLEIALALSGLKMQDWPDTIEVVLSGTASRGLYDAKELEADLMVAILTGIDSLFMKAPPRGGVDIMAQRRQIATMIDLVKQHRLTFAQVCLLVCKPIEFVVSEHWWGAGH